MRYTTYITNLIQTDAEVHHLQREIVDLSNKIEKDQTNEMFQPYIPYNYRKKSFGRTYRLIGYEKIIDDFSIICFLRILVRGSSEYDSFLDNPHSFDSLIPEDKLLEDHIKRLILKPIKEKPKLSTVENTFLYSTKTNLYKDNILILETEAWVNRISNKEFDDYRSDFVFPIRDIIQNENLSVYNILENKNKPKIKIVYKYFPDDKHLLLIAPIISEEKNIPREISNKYSDVLSSKYIFNREELLKIAIKSYPEIITYEDDLWLTIQKNKEGNLALSPEEEEIVKKINDEDLRLPKYPLFINGRAGSGKSTILIYLFSDILYSYIKYNTGNVEKMEMPIFITYSNFLLKNVKDYTIKLFECNSEKIINSEGVYDKNESQKLIEAAFKKFDDFIIETMGEKYKLKYVQEKYIDFNIFKKLLSKYLQNIPQHTLRNLSPELCWHIIRTYIKGMNNEENSFLDPDDYKELPRNFKTVKYDTYEIVYEKIWKNWYNAEFINKGFWDSQDITKQLLNLDINISKYPAIFCDEAQDFTRNELNLIFKLSLFSNRQVDHNYLKLIPFAFAGDPFQTLNPTGFNWTSIKSNFHDKIVKPLDKFGKAKLDFNFNELSYNYRSSKSIVQFCNLIQLLRGVLFNIPDLKPQKSWVISEEPIPEYYEIGDEALNKTLKEQTKSGLIIIIPTEEGADKDYIKEDYFLSSIIQDNGDFQGNILTPIKAKGLEFSRVVLYKFGQSYCDKQNFNFLDKINETNSNPEEYLPFQYFLNNLYVASSRAKKRLFIVDTIDGIERFWKKLMNIKEDLYLKYLEINNEGGWDDNSFCEIITGNLNSIKESPDNPLDLAESFYNQGLINKDIDYLKLAKQNFVLAREYSRAGKCGALIYEFTKTFDKAAEKYLEMDELEEALRCYWIGKNFQKVIETIKRYGKSQSDPRYIASQFILNEVESVALLNFLTDNLQNHEFKKIFVSQYLLDSTWLFVLDNMVDEIALSLKKETDLEKRHLTVSKIKSVIDFNELFGIKESHAILLYYSEDYESAIDIWEKIGLITGDNYYISKSKVDKYPNKIEWLFKLNLADEIFNLFNNSDRKLKKLNDVQRIIILETLINKEPELLNSVLIELFKEETKINIKKEFAEKVIAMLMKSKNYHTCFKIYNCIDDENIFKDDYDISYSDEINNPEEFVVLCSQIQKNLDQGDIFKTIEIINILLYNSEYISNVSKIEIYKQVLNAINKIIIQPNDIENKKLQLKIVDFLTYLSNYTLNIFGVQLIGSCFERSGYLIPTLEYYESIVQNKSKTRYSETDILFSKIRWVKTKDRQGITTNNSNNRDKAKEYFEAWKLNKHFGSISEIEEYPNIKPLSINYENIFKFISNDKESPLFNPLDDFEISLKKEKKMLKIRNKNSDEWVMLNYLEKNMSCDVEYHTIVNEKQNGWYIKSWELFILYNKNGKNSIFLAYKEIDNIIKEFNDIY